ncbi:hypothetical protein AEGHOMDF_1047 [Methylobacterium soli]|nr:hypothetical protein AEGHOMDF_1047 [Methylobacterium soli]
MVVVKVVVVAPPLQITAVAAQPLAVVVDRLDEPHVDLARVGGLPTLFAVGEQDRVRRERVPAVGGFVVSFLHPLGPGFEQREIMVGDRV